MDECSNMSFERVYDLVSVLQYGCRMAVPVQF